MKALVLLMLLALSLALPAIVLAAPLGPLDVPHVSQWGPGASAHVYDCGAAAAAMLLDAYGLERGSVDATYEAMMPWGDAPLSLFRALEPFLDAAGLPVTAYQFTTTAKMVQLLDGRRPFVAHVWGDHFVVVIGLDVGQGLAWVHDPLWGYGPAVWRLSTLERALGSRRVILAPDAGMAREVER